VVLNDNGVPDFNRLQNAIDSAQAQDIVMFLFDLPYLGEADLRALPLRTRRAVLKELLDAQANDIVRFSESFEVQPAQLLGAACKMGLEGVMVKRADAPYVSGRTETWMKLKCQLRQEFVVVGFTDRSGGAKEVGGLLLGYYEDGVLHHAGSVGTGWGAETGHALYIQPVKMEVEKPALDAAEVKPGRWSKRKAGSERWVKPIIVVEVAFAEWTPDKRIRHAVFRGVRTDKPANAIVREQAQSGVSAGPPTSTPKASHRSGHGAQEARPGSVLRKCRRVDAAPPERPAGLPGPRTYGHHR
jgi:bifunctional non-homologous end joining protein LigD